MAYALIVFGSLALFLGGLGLLVNWDRPDEDYDLGKERLGYRKGRSR